MASKDFTTSIEVNQTPAEVFKAVTNPRAWWSLEIEGNTEKLNEIFNYHYKDAHRAQMKLIEVVPDKKVVWQVLDNYFNFTQDEHEWKGNTIVFEITPKGNKTLLQFTQVGLTPEEECYDICEKAWGNYIESSLYNLITTGKGEPNPKEGGFNEQILQEIGKS
ncbi:ATPase [Niastella koreensis]|uniref:Activator of Hsp90 ATPase 1 family protein n=2 Tax=Niastella koreensis TaxID=354356 RepID=G8T9H2_NIAKG|nr:SRPBCC domain-containing protein [Niastella koreensis]AEV99162.1 Activator of Hsp90 ATPase 1 family protein [Niastella koreensis GR20-10]OQP44063.1 ATPase [Niastella koreensis]